MTEQPDALRLADALETLSPLERDAAAELRRLHSVNAQLLEALVDLGEHSARMGNIAFNLGQGHRQWENSIRLGVEAFDSQLRKARAAIDAAKGGT